MINPSARLRIFLVISSICLLITSLINATSVFPFADEYSFQGNVLHFLKTRTLDPFWTNYPTFYSYVIAVPIAALYYGLYFLSGLPLHGLNDSLVAGLFYENHFEVWLLAGRALSALCSLGVLWLITGYAARRNGNFAAAVAALILMLDPFNIFLPLSRLALPDMLVTLLFTSGVLLSGAYVRHNKIKFLYAAAALCGLAAGAKINGVLAAFAIYPALHFNREQRSRAREYLRITTIILLFFFASSPFLLITPQAYSYGFTSEVDILLPGKAADMLSAGPIGLMRLIGQRDPGFAILAGLALLHAARKRQAADLVFLSVTAASFLTLGFLKKHSLWYLLPLFPIAAGHISLLLDETLQRFSLRAGKNIKGAVLGICLLSVGIKLASDVYTHTRPDNRITAENWISGHLAKNSFFYSDCNSQSSAAERSLVFGYLQHPNVNNKSAPNYGLYQKIREELLAKRRLENIDTLLLTGFKLPDKEGSRPEYLIVTDTCYQPYLADGARFTTGDPQVHALRGDFYRRAFQGAEPLKLLKSFSGGLGPTVHIFQR